MKKLASALAVAVLIAGIPAMAQHRDAPGPQANHGGPQAGHGPKRPQFRELTQSRGHKWHKGQRLAANDRRYVVNDWNQRGLRAPPRGYQWVRENNNSGDFLLVAAATGIISSILAQQ